MVPDQDMSLKLSNAMDISPAAVKNSNATKLPEEMVIWGSNRKDYASDSATMNVPPDKIMANCASGCQDNAVGMEISPGGHDHTPASGGRNEDLEVDVVGDVNTNEERLVGTGRDSPDVTECSSSFGSTDSEAENAAMLSNEEVESQMREDNAPFMGFNGFSDLFRPRYALP